MKSFYNSPHISQARSFGLFMSMLFMVQFGMAQGTIKVDYYDGQNFDRYVTTRMEDHIDKYWNEVPPVDGIDPHDCSIRFTTRLKPGLTGEYAFSARVDDGIRVWLNDDLIIDNWKLNDVGISESKVHMESGAFYELKVEYFNALIEGEITLLWDIPDEKEKWYSFINKRNFEVIAPQYFVQPRNHQISLAREITLVAEITEDQVPLANEPTRVKVEQPKSKNPKVEKSNGNPPTVKEEVTPVKEIILTDEIIDSYKPKNIQFERSKTSILLESFKELDRFAQFMVDHPDLTVQIEGHTDPIGNEEKNQLLSERRAYIVASYMVKKGVVASRIKAVGHGGTKPLVVPKEGEYFPGNRRVEFIVKGL